MSGFDFTEHDMMEFKKWLSKQVSSSRRLVLAFAAWFFVSGVVYWLFALVSPATDYALAAWDNIMVPVTSADPNFVWALSSHFAGLAMFLLITKQQLRWVFVSGVGWLAMLWALEVTIPKDFLLCVAHALGYATLAVSAILFCGLVGGLVQLFRESLHFMRRMVKLYPEASQNLRHLPLLQQVVVAPTRASSLDTVPVSPAALKQSYASRFSLDNAPNFPPSMGRAESDLDCESNHNEDKSCFTGSAFQLDEGVTGQLCFMCGSKSCALVPVCASWAEAEQQGAVPIQRICTPYASLKHDRKRLEAELAQSRRAAQQEARQKADMSEQLRVCQETVAAQAKSMAEANSAIAEQHACAVCGDDLVSRGQVQTEKPRSKREIANGTDSHARLRTEARSAEDEAAARQATRVHAGGCHGSECTGTSSNTRGREVGKGCLTATMLQSAEARAAAAEERVRVLEGEYRARAEYMANAVAAMHDSGELVSASSVDVTGCNAHGHPASSSSSYPSQSHNRASGVSHKCGARGDGKDAKRQIKRLLESVAEYASQQDQWRLAVKHAEERAQTAERAAAMPIPTLQKVHQQVPAAQQTDAALTRLQTAFEERTMEMSKLQAKLLDAEERAATAAQRAHDSDQQLYEWRCLGFVN